MSKLQQYAKEEENYQVYVSSNKITMQSGMPRYHENGVPSACKCDIAAWQAKFSEMPSKNLSGQICQTYQLFKIAVEFIGGSTEAVRDAMLAVEMNGPAGHMSFDGFYIFEIVQLDDGSYNYQIVKTNEKVAPGGLLPG